MHTNISDWHVETQYLWELGWNVKLDVQCVNALQYTLSINPIELSVSVRQREQWGRWRTSLPYHIVVHTCNPSTQDALVGGLQVWGQTGQHSDFGASLDDTVRPCFNNKRKKKAENWNNISWSLGLTIFGLAVFNKHKEESQKRAVCYDKRREKNLSVI